jgi:hypothetical protein
MKRLIFLITFGLLFLRCTAPELNFTLRNDQAATCQLNRLIVIQDILIEKTRKELAEQFQKFISKLQFIESSGNWKSINKLGCIGLFQFAPGTLKWLGHPEITPEAFKINPEIFPPSMQVQVLNELIKANEKGLKSCFAYIGKVVNGVKITKAGLIAGAHLSGVGGVTAFLESSGQTNRHDINSMTVQKYIKAFSEYNI